MANNIPATSVSHHSFLSDNFLESLFLDSVSEQEVIEICKSLKSGTAVGYDNVSVDLNNRQQFVQFNDTSTSRHVIKCGVNQGSILGPLLFLLYINDLCNVSQVFDFSLFADDANIIFSRKDILEKNYE